MSSSTNLAEHIFTSFGTLSMRSTSPMGEWISRIQRAGPMQRSSLISPLYKKLSTGCNGILMALEGITISRWRRIMFV